MLRLISITATVLMLSCIDADPVSAPVEEAQNLEAPSSNTTQGENNPYVRDEVWVCNHPGTDMHNKVCIEEQYPDGCYVRGDDSAFCWLLMRPECENLEKYPSVRDVCHLLR